MKFIYAEYNIYHNSIDITTLDGYILRIDCNKAEEGLKATAWTAMCQIQIFVDAEDSLDM